jgi:7-alpha-hydroxysteroid dehydrogenase
MYSPEDFTLNGQVAVIIGAGAAIGRAIARTFAGAGAAVMISDLDAGHRQLGRRRDR